MSIIKMRGPIDVLFAFKIFSLPVPTRPGTRTFWQVPDPSRPEVKNPYPSDPDHHPKDLSKDFLWFIIQKIFFRQSSKRFSFVHHPKDLLAAII